MIVGARRAGSSISKMAALLGFPRPSVYRKTPTDRHIKQQYNSGVENNILERTTHRSLSQMGYCNRRPHGALLLSAKNKKTGSSGHVNTNTGQLSGKISPGT
jgi:hypothetical protein